MNRWLGAAVLVLLAGSGLAAQMTKYKVTTEADKQTDFASLKTYVWESGWTAYYEVPHEQIVAAIDKELAARGLTRRGSGPSDVTVTYAVVTRMDMDEKGKLTNGNGEWPTYPVSTLHVLIREPGTHRDLFRGRASTPVLRDPEKLGSIIAEQIGKIFEDYPVRVPKKG
jgi:hypothetical protein